MPSQEEMRRACSGRDASYDGVFFLAVLTTGIFCRPSCPARTPKPENSEYFAIAGEALHAGFRPCKRCRPMDTNGRPPQWVELLLAIVDADPSDRITDLNLRSLAVDPARARRYFNKHYGMTFQAYARARRMGEALSQIRRGADLTHTALDHGYGSNSGFREAFSRDLRPATGQEPQRRRLHRYAYAGESDRPFAGVCRSLGDLRVGVSGPPSFGDPGQFYQQAVRERRGSRHQPAPRPSSQAT